MGEQRGSGAAFGGGGPRDAATGTARPDADAGAAPSGAGAVHPGGAPGGRPQRRGISRRAFLGLGGTAALTLLLAPRLAWGGVGGGSWGNAGGTAYPGSHFGYDGGWGYSSNGKVWLAVSSNATIGRMTELFVEIAVTSYYANGGGSRPRGLPTTPTLTSTRSCATRRSLAVLHERLLRYHLR